MRVLVIPASKYGGTAEIGRAIARTLRDCGVDVDVSQPEDIHDLSHYQGFVIGSALYMGKWLPQADTFVDEHADTLRRLPTWLFSSGPLGAKKPSEPLRPEVRAHLMELAGAIEHRLFGGRLEMHRLNRSDRFIAHWVGIEDSDHREWDEIEAWARTIAEHFVAQPPPAATDSTPTT